MAAAVASARAADRTIVVIVASLIALQPLSVDLFLPAMPGAAAALAVSPSQVQATMSVFIAVFAVMQLVAGPLADRFGRRPMVLGGLAVYLAGSALAALAPSIGALTIGRALQAVGTCCVAVSARAIVRDCYEPVIGVRRLSQAMSVAGLVPLAAPFVGGLLFALAGWRAPLWAMVAGAATVFALCAMRLPETHPDRDGASLHPARLASDYLSVLRSPVWRAYTVLGSAVWIGLFAFLVETAFVLSTAHGLSATATGFAMSVITANFLFGTILSRRLMPRLGVQRTLVAATTVAALAGLGLLALALTGLDSPASIVVTQGLFVLAHGLSQPAWQNGALAHFPHRAATAASATGFVQHLVAALVGVLLAGVHDGSALPSGAAMAAAGVLAWLATVTLVRRHGDLERNAAPRPAGAP